MEVGFPGGYLVLGAVLSIWANDACAYLVGSRIGRHKLAPRISPKKSWEGLFGGLVASIVVWVLMTWSRRSRPTALSRPRFHRCPCT